MTLFVSGRQIRGQSESHFEWTVGFEECGGMQGVGTEIVKLFVVQKQEESIDSRVRALRLPGPSSERRMATIMGHITAPYPPPKGKGKGSGKVSQKYPALQDVSRSSNS